MSRSDCPILLTAGNECYHTLALHSFVGGPSAEPQGWQTTSGEAMFVVRCVLRGLAKLFQLGVGEVPARPCSAEGRAASLDRRLALIFLLQFLAQGQRLVPLRR